jgi:hypothetical protein
MKALSFDLAKPNKRLSSAQLIPSAIACCCSQLSAERMLYMLVFPSTPLMHPSVQPLTALFVLGISPQLATFPHVNMQYRSHRFSPPPPPPPPPQAESIAKSIKEGARNFLMIISPLNVKKRVMAYFRARPQEKVINGRVY